MKSFKLLIIIVCFSYYASAQTIVATTKDPYSTFNHNQRKVVRDMIDNVYVVYTDWVPPVYVIKGIKLDGQTGAWSDPFFITEGYNPTLAISDVFTWDFHLVYQTLDSINMIMYRQSTDFLNWGEEIQLSDSGEISKSPIADIDSLGALNIFWQQENMNITSSLIYTKLLDGIQLERTMICTKNEINDYAIANNLQYMTNDLFFGVEFNQDSVAFFRSTDGMISYDTVYVAAGTQPGITCNSSYEYEEDSRVRFLYLNPSSYLIEVEVDYYWNVTEIGEIPVGLVDYYCVDDIAPPIGYSFLFMQSGILHHAFSYGVWWNWSSIMETIYGSDIAFPSIAYKHFSFDIVDFIWMEGYSAEKSIHYMRDEKHIWNDIDEDSELGKGFSITGFPNPFSDQHKLNIKTDIFDASPCIEIYNSGSELIIRPLVKKISEDEYTACWDGRNQSGHRVDPGLYIVLCSVGDKRTARKIILEP